MITLNTVFEGGNSLMIYDVSVFVGSVSVGALLYKSKEVIDSGCSGHPAQGKMKISANLEADNASVNALLASKLSSKTVEDVSTTTEDSDTIQYLSGGDNTKYVYAILTSGLLGATRKVYEGLCQISNEMSFAHGAKKASQVKFEFSVVAGWAVTCGSAKYDSGLLSGMTTVSLASTEYGTINFRGAV